MSDLMFYGVLRMPFELAMSDYMSQRQFYDRAQEAADRVEAADKRIAELEAENAEQLRIMQGRLEVAEAGFRRANERVLLLEQRVGELARSAD